MEEQIKKAVRFVRMSYLLFWMVPVVFVLVGETTDSWVGAYADDVRTTYYAETLSILLAAACVPLSLKLFAWVLYRRIDRAGIARALQLYVFWSGIRLVLLALPLMAGFLTYYGMLSTTGLLCLDLLRDAEHDGSALRPDCPDGFALLPAGRGAPASRVAHRAGGGRLMSRSYFEGTLVRLRPMEPEDLDLLYRMENDPETWDVSNFSVPYSRYVLKQYIEDSQCDMFADKQLRLMIVRRTDDVVVGTVDVTDFAPMHRRGEVGIAVRKEFRGNGYAGEALTLMCDYLFRFLFVHQLTAHVAVDNEASRRLFAGAGFVECGVLKEWWFAGGRYRDVVLLQRLHEV